MTGNEREPLTVNNDAKNNALKLCSLLLRLPLDDDMRDHFRDLHNQVLHNTITLAQFFKDEKLKSFIELLKTQYQEKAGMLSLIRAWWNAPHYFSIYEKTIFGFSLTMIGLGVAFINEILIEYNGGESQLHNVGYALEALCMPSELTDAVASTCASLQNGTMAVFDMTLGITVNPSYIGQADVNSAPNLLMQIIQSWIQPSAFKIGYTCFQSPDARELALTGHLCVGKIGDVQGQAANGFPVYRTTTPIDSTSFLYNATILSALQGFMAMFCIRAEEGGFSDITHQHFGSYKRFAETFGENAKIFGAVYGYVVGLACIALAALLIKRVATKWNAAMLGQRVVKQYGEMQQEEQQPLASNGH